MWDLLSFFCAAWISTFCSPWDFLLFLACLPATCWVSNSMRVAPAYRFENAVLRSLTSCDIVTWLTSKTLNPLALIASVSFCKYSLVLVIDSLVLSSNLPKLSKRFLSSSWLSRSVLRLMVSLIGTLSSGFTMASSSAVLLLRKSISFGVALLLFITLDNIPSAKPLWFALIALLARSMVSLFSGLRLSFSLSKASYISVRAFSDWSINGCACSWVITPVLSMDLALYAASADFKWCS